MRATDPLPTYAREINRSAQAILKSNEENSRRPAEQGAGSAQGGTGCRERSQMQEGAGWKRLDQGL
ncbi:MAG TPA: hypothetical protein VF172_09035 [Nitrososphaera sp.]